MFFRAQFVTRMLRERFVVHPDFLIPVLKVEFSFHIPHLTESIARGCEWSEGVSKFPPLSTHVLISEWPTPVIICMERHHQTGHSMPAQKSTTSSQVAFKLTGRKTVVWGTHLFLPCIIYLARCYAAFSRAKAHAQGGLHSQFPISFHAHNNPVR